MEEEGKYIKRDFHYVYFFENHVTNSNVRISLKNKSNEVNMV